MRLKSSVVKTTFAAPILSAAILTSSPLAANTSITLEAESASLSNGAQTYSDGAAVGGQGVAYLSSNQASMTLANAPEASKIIVRYASEQSGGISIFVDGADTAQLPFSTTGSWGGTYGEASLPLNVPAGADFEIRFENGDAALNIDNVTFITETSNSNDEIVEAEAATLNGDAQTFNDGAASGGQGVAYLNTVGSGITFSNAPAASSVTIYYASMNTGSISLKVDGQDAGNIDFTSTGNWGGNYNAVTRNVSVTAGADFTIQFDSGDAAMNVDYVVFTSEGNVEPPQLPTVALLLDPALKDDLQAELSQFKTDLYNDGYATIEHDVTETTPPELRAYLQGLYSDANVDLAGAILIGSVPNPRYYIYYEAANGLLERGPLEGVSYQYYEDLDGVFELKDQSTWTYDGHTGDVESEIWVSALPPMDTHVKTVDAMQRYFEKNHRYRIGLDGQEKGTLYPILGSTFNNTTIYNSQVETILGTQSNTYQYTWGPMTTRGNVIVAPDNLLNDPVNYPGSAEVFYDFIGSGNHDVVITSTHGNPYLISAGTSTYDRDYLNNNPLNVTLWMEAGCATADLDVVPSFGVTALYSETSQILVYKGATMNQGGLGYNADNYYRMTIGEELAAGTPIAEAFLKHRGQPMTGTTAQQREYFAAQYVMLGDGTIKLRQ